MYVYVVIRVTHEYYYSDTEAIFKTFLACFATLKDAWIALEQLMYAKFNDLEHQAQYEKVSIEEYIENGSWSMDILPDESTIMYYDSDSTTKDMIVKVPVQTMS